ncbi:hypothetical protein [Entomomonas asaccharolytica]|uniref:Uncharacterized protein n=1 Tax=Entomomonas asaccharolytica TaxID=2785331 RepID=A0A974NDC0_9GAMM|nr:hypothetical protein [Entomomonas asaccharolytica]QQP84645.1 hypothetical protein JHT90_09510 [Entomomonas asaccharolytica]
MIICLLGCTPRVTFFPDNLPVAIVGEPYNTEIKIQGGGAGISSSSFYIDISPTNGLKAEVIHIPEPYSSIRIYGEPENSVDTTIQIFGDTLGTSFPGKEFNKTYVIKVKETE